MIIEMARKMMYSIVGWTVWQIWHTDSYEEDDDMYDDTRTDVQWREWWRWIFWFWIDIADFSLSYMRVYNVIAMKDMFGVPAHSN